MATSTSIPAVDEKPITTSLEYVKEEGKYEERVSQVDPEAQKSLLRKLDYRMMPVFFVMYFLNHCKISCCPSYTSLN
jgi:hypothetical protein